MVVADLLLFSASAGRVARAVAVAVCVVVAVAAAPASTAAALGSASSSSTSRALSVLNVEGLLLSLSEADGVDVGVCFFILEGGGE